MLSNARLTHYTAAAHRGRTAIDEINVLPQYRGTCVHDGLLAYTHYTHCWHALCGMHLLRELTSNVATRPRFGGLRSVTAAARRDNTIQSRRSSVAGTSSASSRNSITLDSVSRCGSTLFSSRDFASHKVSVPHLPIPP
jgi:Transposase IS66 family